MNAHMKTYRKYQCEYCSKTFKYKELMEKHTQISHENVKIYCYYYNNKKICPYDTECIFLHEESRICKFGNLCERLFCMFRHEIEIAEEQVNISEMIGIDVVNIIEIVETETIEGDSEEKIVNIDEPDDVELNNEVSNCTFVNPSQTDQHVNEARFKCDKCDFSLERQTILNDHKVVNHNWCSVCYSNFSNQENLKKHIKKRHSKKKAN